MHPRALCNPASLAMGCVLSLVMLVSLSSPAAAQTSLKLSLAPANPSLRLATSQQFTVAVSGAATNSTTTLKWTLSPATGAGTLTASGSAAIYAAPAALPTGTVTITVAATNGKSSASTSTTITLLNPVPALSSLAPTAMPIGISAHHHRQRFVPGSVINLGGVPLATDYISSTSLAAVINLSSSGTYSVTVSNPAPGAVTTAAIPLKASSANGPSYAATARFLGQAGFSPTPALIAHVQSIGFAAYLKEQLAASGSSWQPLPATATSQDALPAQFYTNAIANNDQLRQRMALALSEIMVTSGVKINQSPAILNWQNLLLKDAFATYPTLLNDVTLSPSMGHYLDMVNNEKANAAKGTVPTKTTLVRCCSSSPSA